jgi:rare lipoprotein A (peptidoglycan hydrolase)
MHRFSALTARVALALALVMALEGFHRPAARRHPHEIGLASYYANEVGPRTASGERFDARAMTAAHRTLPFGTRVRVTNLRNGRSVIVRINDRGPFIRTRVIDLSHAAAQQLRLVAHGVARVRLDVLPPPIRAHGRSRPVKHEVLWRRPSVVPWGPIAARLDVTKRVVRMGRELA